MKHRLTIEFETADTPQPSFRIGIAQHVVEKALMDYLGQCERERLASLKQIFKVTETKIESTNSL